MFDKVSWDEEPERNEASIHEEVLKQRAIKRITKNLEIHTLKAKALSDLCSKPKPNEQWRIITEKQFNAFALILYVLKTEQIDELHLAVYRINEPTVKAIIDYIEAGRIRSATFVISSFFNQTKKPEQWAIMLRDYCKKQPRTKHVYTHNHAKVVAIKTTDNNHYVFEGSGNMSDNARIEQYLYENNRLTFEFHKEWMQELSDEGINE